MTSTDATEPETHGSAAAERDPVEVVVGAARVFSAVTAESIAQAGDSVTLPQLRVLTLTATRGALSNGEIAAALGVHISNASRLCERLVQAGLLARRDSPSDRRQVQLTITERGTQLLETVTDHRRAVFTEVLDLLPASQQAALSDALADFTRAADQVLRAPRAYLP